MKDRVENLVEIVGVTEPEWQRLRLTQRVQAALGLLGNGVRRCRVAFADDNGPKRGIDTRCTIDVRISHWPPIHVEGRAISVGLALQQALNRLKRRISRALAANRIASRRPKKYFVAARALSRRPLEEGTYEFSAASSGRARRLA